jgi:hypothetical protein
MGDAATDTGALAWNTFSGADYFDLMYQSYFDGTNYKYAAAAAASRISQRNGNITFDRKAAGTADATFTWDNSLTIDSSGNVGIGTSTASNLLTLGASGGPTMRLIDTTSGVFGLIQSGSNGDFTISADHGNAGASTNILFKSDGATERMRIDSSGRVGIGTASPGYKLSILENANNFLHLSQAGDSVAGSLIGRSSSKNLRIQQSENAPIEFWTNNTERMRIDSSGNVGIGTSSPIEKVTASGAIVSTASNSTGSTSGANRAILDFTSGGARIGHFRGTTAAGSGYASFYTDSSERMRIDSSGNVGIGTTSPSRNLHINDASESNIRLQGGSDYAELRVKDADNAFSFHFGGSERMRIDSSGNLLVGGTSQSGTANRAAIFSANKFGLSVIDTTSFTTNVGGALNLGGNYRTAGDAQAFCRVEALKENATDGNFAYGMAFSTTPNGGTFTERMRINSSGQLIVGHDGTGSAYFNEGIFLNPAGDSVFHRDGNSVVDFSRETSDGNIVRFVKDNSVVGSIGSSGGQAFFAGNSKGIRFSTLGFTGTDNAGTLSDGAIDIGTSSHRIKDLYLSGGAYLGGTGSANLLDDYEEGTFEVTAAPATSGTATINSSYNTLSYTKIGRLVTITGEIRISSFSSAVGNLILNSLPFTVASLTDVAGRAFTATYFYQGSTAAISAEILYVADNSTQLQIFKNTNTMTNNSEIGISISYVAA